jgi:hypothetical protein
VRQVLPWQHGNVKHFNFVLDCERSLLSAGLAFRACEEKGGTADNTSRNEIRPLLALVKLASPLHNISYIQLNLFNRNRSFKSVMFIYKINIKSRNYL